MNAKIIKENFLSRINEGAFIVKCFKIKKNTSRKKFELKITATKKENNLNGVGEKIFATDSV